MFQRRESPLGFSFFVGVPEGVLQHGAEIVNAAERFLGILSPFLFPVLEIVPHHRFDPVECLARQLLPHDTDLGFVGRDLDPVMVEVGLHLCEEPSQFSLSPVVLGGGGGRGGGGRGGGGGGGGGRGRGT